jgi:hypothetical protein
MLIVHCYLVAVWKLSFTHQTCLATHIWARGEAVLNPEKGADFVMGYVKFFVKKCHPIKCIIDQKYT